MLTLVLLVILAALVFEFINGFHGTASLKSVTIFSQARGATIVATKW